MSEDLYQEFVGVFEADRILFRVNGIAVPFHAQHFGDNPLFFLNWIHYIKYVFWSKSNV